MIKKTENVSAPYPLLLVKPGIFWRSQIPRRPRLSRVHIHVHEPRKRPYPSLRWELFDFYHTKTSRNRLQTHNANAKRFQRYSMAFKGIQSPRFLAMPVSGTKAVHI